MGSKGFVNKAKSGAVAAPAHQRREGWKARRDRSGTRPVKSIPKQRIEPDPAESQAKKPGA